MQARRVASLIELESTKDMVGAYSGSTGSTGGTGSTEITGYGELESRVAEMVDAEKYEGRYHGIMVLWRHNIIYPSPLLRGI